MQIEFQSNEVNVKSGTSSRTGKPYSIREQQGWLHDGGRYPKEIKVNVPDDVAAYAVGFYEVTTPFAVGSYGRLMVNRNLGLTPAKQARAAA